MMKHLIRNWLIGLCVLVSLPGVSYGQTAIIQELEKRVQELEEKLSGSARGFQFNGYARSGFLMTGEGGSTTNQNDGQPFRAPGAGSKWRLGNEADTYVELGVGKNWFTEDDSTFRVFFMPVYKEFNDRDWVEYGSPEAKLTLRQAYAEAKNPFGKELNFWAGERYYRRMDIHVTDFFYSNPVGLGGGVEDISVGPTKWSLAWINSSRGDDLWLEDKGEFAVNNIYLDIANIDPLLLLKGIGGFYLQASASWTRGGTAVDPSATPAEGEEVEEYPIDSANGWNITARYTMDSFLGLGEGGFSNVFLQYGAGTSSNFSAGSAGLWAFNADNNFQSTVGDSWRTRAGLYGVWRFTEKFEMMPVFVYELSDNGASADSQQTWITAGLRPYYYFTKYFALQFDYGVDYVDPEGGEDGYLHKVSLAPTLKFGSKYFDRPELRAFVTYASWSDGFQGQIGGEAFNDDTEGLLYGVQMEAWW